MNRNKKLSGVISLAILIATTFAISPTASAADKGWRYWAYFQAGPGATKWTSAFTGPYVDIKDGSVEGWSFVFDSDDIPSSPPSIKPNFSVICGKEKANKDTKRIALVIDFGSQSYAPKGEKIKKPITTCVRTAKTSQGVDVLDMVVKLRAAKSGLICGLNGYPKKECGVQIPTPASIKK